MLPHSFQKTNLSANKFICDRAIDDTLHNYSLYTPGAQSNFTSLPHHKDILDWKKGTTCKVTFFRKY